jgi:predicted phage terminase large subunit-like protein
MIGLMQKHSPIYEWAAPADQIKRSVGPFLTKRMAEAKTYVAMREMSEAGDKPAKARSFQGRMAMGKVYFPKQAEWLDDLILEMSMFPVGHDDQIDALGHVGRLLDQMAVGTVPMPAETTHVDDYDFGDRDDSDSWKTA